MNGPRRIVVLGGYGQFGTRICRALLRQVPVDLWIAGRRIERARALAARLEAECGGRSSVGAVVIDIDDPTLARRLGSVAPIVVVHAAGPFQTQSYRVAEACLRYLQIPWSSVWFTAVMTLFVVRLPVPAPSRIAARNTTCASDPRDSSRRDIYSIKEIESPCNAAGGRSR